MEFAGQVGAPPAKVAKSWIYTAMKRLLDVIVSLLLLVVVSPVLAICALAVRLDSPGPVLFRQQRVGEGGKSFTMLKLRTMRVNAGAAPHRDYVAAFIQGKAGAQGTQKGEVFKLVTDPRITRVGRWLRQTSLDELPQLWNVVRGDMSLVGPRPPIPYELDHYTAHHMQRLAVTPGITGLWQVSGRSGTTFDEMIALDVEYIRTRSLTLDLRILFATIPTILKGAH